MAHGDAGTAPGQTATHLPAQGRLDGSVGHEVVPVLRGVLLSACHLTGAAYGAVLLGDTDHDVTDVVSVGDSVSAGSSVSAGTSFQGSRLADLPGLDAYFAALLAAPKPLLRNDIRTRRADHHVPSGHPDMTSLLGAPVHLRDGSYGYLYVAKAQQGEEFSAEDAHTIVTLATAAGLAVNTDRMVGNRPHRLCWLDAITELLHLLHGEVDREVGLQGIADLLKDAAGADTSVIVLVDPADEERQVTIEAAAGLGADLMTGTRLPRGRYLAEAMDSGRPIVSGDVSRDIQFRPPAEWEETLSVLGPGLFVPLTTPTEILGALFVAWRRDSCSDVEVAQVSRLAIPFARAAALVLHQHEARHAGIRQQRWMDAAAETTRRLLDEVEPHEVMSQVTRQIREVSGAAYAAVALTDHVGPQGTVVFDVIDGLGLENASGTRVSCPIALAAVIESGRPVISPNLVRDERYDPPEEWRDALSVLGLAMFVPLRTRCEIQGALIVAWRRGTPEERAARRVAPLVETFADEVALSLQRV
ncbi:MAG: GAF domain-containing protein, partial [Actinopolymorphaceae bacterium]